MAINQLHSLKADRCNLMNSANIALIPKKEGPCDAMDFRPISFMHSIAKILCKLLANRLAPELHYLVSHSQSAFIKKCCIHDNFIYVQNVIREAHVLRKCQPSF